MIRQLLAEQLYRPVRWVETVRKMAAAGISDFYEVGPGRVLAGLTKRIDKSLNVVGVLDPDTLKKAMERSE